MSREIMCDRCGRTTKELKGYNKLNSVEIHPYEGLQLVNKDEWILCADLCNDCVKELSEFIRGGERK